MGGHRVLEWAVMAPERVSAIAVVHDTLSEGLAQNVEFDEVFVRVLKLVAEVAAAPNTRSRRSTKSACSWHSVATRARSAGASPT